MLLPYSSSSLNAFIRDPGVAFVLALRANTWIPAQKRCRNDVLNTWIPALKTLPE
jgi:hypothetical protein